MDAVQLAIPGMPLRMHLHRDTDVHISTALREHGIWEPFETELMRRALSSGQRVLDVGANIGYFTLLAASAVGAGGRVYAFEPEPRNFRLLQQNVSLNGFGDYVHCVEGALSDREGEGELHLNPANLGDHQIHRGDQDRETVPIRLLAGADWFAGRESGLDFVKVDVQGAEHAVVQGLLPLLRNSGATLRMLVELTPRSLREAGSSGRELIETLAGLALPFAIVDHIEHRLAPTAAEDLAVWCDNIDAYPQDAGFMNIFLGPTV